MQIHLLATKESNSQWAIYPTFLENSNGDRANKVVGRYNAIVTT